MKITFKHVTVVFSLFFGVISEASTLTVMSANEPDKILKDESTISTVSFEISSSKNKKELIIHSNNGGRCYVETDPRTGLQLLSLIKTKGTLHLICYVKANGTSAEKITLDYNSFSN